MVAKGYTVADEVAGYLGITFTIAQATEAERLIEVAEKRIDNYCRRAWLAGDQTDEAHYGPWPDGDLYLKYPPVVSVTGITGRTSLDSDEETLVADDDYEVRDLETGWIRLSAWLDYDRVLVTYVVDDEVPADVVQAAIELVAAWMRPQLANLGGLTEIESYSLPDLTVRFAKQAQGQSSAMPPSVETLLEPYRLVTVA